MIDNQKSPPINLPDLKRDANDRLTALKEELRDNALLEWVKAGGDPTRFAAAWPSIEQQVLDERVIANLINRPAKQPISIHF